MSPQSYSGLGVAEFPYPIISDPDRDLAVQLGMLDPVEKDKAGLPLTCRAVRSTRHMQTPLFSSSLSAGVYCWTRQETQTLHSLPSNHWTKLQVSPFATHYLYSLFGCVVFSEILRVIDSLQLTVNKKVATPADWTVGVWKTSLHYKLIFFYTEWRRVYGAAKCV